MEVGQWICEMCLVFIIQVPWMKLATVFTRSSFEQKQASLSAACVQSAACCLFVLFSSLVMFLFLVKLH